MTDAAADIGYLSKFKVGDGGSPTVYTALAALMSFTPPSIAFGERQTTHLGTPGHTHTFAPTLSDPGEVPCTIQYFPGGTEEAAILALFDRSTRKFEIEYPNGARVQFEGFAKSFTPEAVELEGTLQASFVVRVSGKPTYIPAPAGAAPANSSVPTITGTPKVGVPLTGAVGTWTGAPTPWFSYQWKVDGVAVPGATGSVFVPLAAHEGDPVTLTVTGFNQHGSVAATSAATGNVAAA